MPGVTGLEIVEGMRSINQSLPIILITAFGDRATHEKAKQHGVTAIFDKPFDMDKLLDKIQVIASCASLR
jgi:FixJ family two-component response regulator